MTIEQILMLFKDIAERHKQINGYKVSEDSSFGMIDDRDFPLLTITPTDMNLPNNENGFSEFVSSFDIKILDLVNDNEDNKIHVYSDAVEILKDVIGEFSTHPYYMDLGLAISSDATLDKIEGLTDSDLFGYGSSIDLTSPNKISFCGSPISNLSGFNFSAPVVTVTDGGTVIELTGGDAYTCNATALTDGIITNSDGSFNDTVADAGTLILGDITHTDSDGSSVITPAQIPFVATVCAVPPTPSGIQYQRPSVMAQDTSYATNDNAWNIVNGVYTYVPPVLPIHTAALDLTHATPYYFLVENNVFGNKDRFTALDGTNVYPSNYVIDHLTGLGWGRTMLGLSTNWNAKLIEATGLTIAGFSDFRLPSQTEYTSVIQQNSYALNNAPFLCPTSSSVFTCSDTSHASSTSNTRLVRNNTQFSADAKSTAVSSRAYIPVRNHF